MHCFLPQEEARVGVDYFLAFTTEDGMDLDGAHILKKGLLQEVETGAVVQVGIFHSEKELRHIPTSRHVHPKKTRSPRDPPAH